MKEIFVSIKINTDSELTGFNYSTRVSNFISLIQSDSKAIKKFTSSINENLGLFFTFVLPLNTRKYPLKKLNRFSTTRWEKIDLNEKNMMHQEKCLNKQFPNKMQSKAYKTNPIFFCTN